MHTCLNTIKVNKLLEDIKNPWTAYSLKVGFVIARWTNIAGLFWLVGWLVFYCCCVFFFFFPICSNSTFLPEIVIITFILLELTFWSLIKLNFFRCKLKQLNKHIKHPRIFENILTSLVTRISAMRIILSSHLDIWKKRVFEKAFLGMLLVS